MIAHDSIKHKLIPLGKFKPKDRNYAIGKFFASMSVGILYLFILVAYSLVVGIGIFIGYIWFKNTNQGPPATIETEIAAILGLLAFMLSFTFTVTWTRFSRRNTLLLSHAKAITLCYLRTSLIPDKQKLEMRSLFHDYIAVLLALQATPDLEKLLAKVEALHLSMWNETASLVHEEMDGELRSLFTSSVNDLISLYTERKTIVLFFRMPDAIWSALLFLGAIGMLTVGYQCGINGMHNLFQLIFLPLAFGLVIVLISDINSSRSKRNFKVTERPLKEVQELMGKNIA
jgi:hypothetical protein